MITGPAVQDVAAPDRFESSVVPMQYPAPRAPERSVFSGLECFATLRLFNFRSTIAGFFLQFALQIRNIFFKTDRSAVGTRRLVDLPLSRFCPRWSSCNNRFSAAIERPSITAQIASDPRHSPLVMPPQHSATGYRTSRPDVDDPGDGLLVWRCTYQICSTIYG
jgi:hypothetical protein